MKRIKRHKIKTEHPESSYSRDHGEHDLAYYIHDRVELMHQVFSVLKYKDLKAMAPECVRNLPVGDLQELCTEELLGISSKRLLATLDGADPPSDTDSSSQSPTPDPMETISLDSISSDEEILSQASKKKKHKHRRNSKSKAKRREKNVASTAEDTTEVSKASRAGLTVLELLELQARARAIRAQLQNEQAKKQAEAVVPDSNTDDEVEIKEEEPDVVEISSGDEKPDITTLQLAVQKHSKPSKPKENHQEPQKSTESVKTKEPAKSKESSKSKEPQPREPVVNKDKESPEKTTVTRRISDLIITVPQAKVTRKIKLNRNKVTVTVPNVTENTVEACIVTVERPVDKEISKDGDKIKKKQKRRKKKTVEKEGSDHDEITLQLSDSEKMDLLEDLNEKNYDRLSSSSSDSESSSSDSDANVADTVTAKSNITEATETVEPDENNKMTETELESNEIELESNKTELESNKTDKKDDKVQSPAEESAAKTSESLADKISVESPQETQSLIEITEKVIEENVIDSEENSEPISSGDANKTQIEYSVQENQVTSESLDKDVVINEENVVTDVITTETHEVENNIVTEPPKANESEQTIDTNTVDTPITSGETNEQDIPANANQDDKNKDKESEREISEGELSDRESSEVEAVDIEPEVVCISDEEKQKSNKKKKKKEKKAKKMKKSKKSKQDFREGGDQNFYKDANNIKLNEASEEPVVDSIDVTDDDVYEILELSDDSSCYEVEGTVLSKEPTAEEIEALSAKIDEIKREDVDPPHDNSQQANADEESEPETHMSWKDRYLDSTKVKKVLTTANILNALRKKNKELKRKIEEAKKQEKEVTDVQENVLEEGSIEHYQTLPAGSKFVDPVVEEKMVETEVVDEEAVTREMKKDAKQLLKMYKKLMNSKKDKRREKKKKRKQKKQAGEIEASQTDAI